MVTSELIAETAKAAGMSRASVKRVLLAMFPVIAKTATSGERVQIVGFGTFFMRHLAPKLVPSRKGPAVQYGARVALRFSAYKEVRRMQKYGVEIDKRHEKLSEVKGDPACCPRCKEPLDSTTPPHCPNCGTQPFERRPDGSQEKAS